MYRNFFILNVCIFVKFYSIFEILETSTLSLTLQYVHTNQSHQGKHLTNFNSKQFWKIDKMFQRNTKRLELSWRSHFEQQDKGKKEKNLNFIGTYSLLNQNFVQNWFVLVASIHSILKAECLYERPQFMCMQCFILACKLLYSFSI